MTEPPFTEVQRQQVRDAIDRALAWGGDARAVRASWDRLPEASREVLAYERLCMLVATRQDL
jgi:hypothetical protein